MPGDTQPISFDADEVVAWKEGDLLVVRLQGRVLVQHGVVQARFDRGVAWIDQERYRRTGLLRVSLYAEGRCRLDVSESVRDVPEMALQLTTRGVFNLRSHQGPLQRKALARDPLVMKARGLRVGPALPEDRARRRVSPPASPPPLPGVGLWPPLHEGPASAGPGGGVRRVGHEEPAPPPSRAGPPGIPTRGPTPPGGARKSPTGKVPPGGQTRLDPGGSTPTGPGGVRLAQAIGPGETGAGVAGAPPPPLPPPSRPGRPAPPPRPGPPRQYSVAPRQGGKFNVKIERISDEEQAVIVTGGVILHVRNAPDLGLLDIEADRLVIWTRSLNPQQLFNNLQSPQGDTNKDLEFYLAGNVQIRRTGTKEEEERTLRADEVYYDVNRNVAVALSAELELKQPHIEQPVVVKSDELLQTSATTFEMVRAEIFASKLPSDPGLKVYVTRATVEERTVPVTSIFGWTVPGPLGAPPEKKQTWVVANDVFVELEDVPFFYLPYLATDARDPLGPLEALRFGYSQVFGTQVGVSLDLYEILGLNKLPGTRWLFDTDYLSARGPGLGTTFHYGGKDLLGIRNEYAGMLRAWGIYDRDFDNLGGYRRLNNFDPPGPRGRILWRQGIYDLPYGFNIQSQVSGLSDRNFLEQYFKREFDTSVNQSTFFYLKQQQDNWAWTALTQGNLRNWVTEPEWLPRLDGYLIGQDFLDLFTYNAQASIAYAQLNVTSDGPPFLSPTDVPANTGRFHLMQDLSLPFSLGPVRLVPYGRLALTDYTEDLQGDQTGRAWGGGGLRASIPFSRLYPDVCSDFWNVYGIHHKIVLRANYFNADTNEPHTNFPQLDRLNDDTSDQSVRDIRPFLPILNPAHATALATLPIYDPQIYAIRRLVLNRIDTLDAIEVVQLGARQRWQTKRGFPGARHIIDWMVLDTSATYFPNADRDNLGKSWAFLQYNFLWNVGDRTALTSTAWVDPGGDERPYVFTVGAHFNRPDRTNFYLGYRQIEPVQSRAVTGSVRYIFSPKYAMSLSSSYDFGVNQALSNSVVFTRVGKDLQISVGLTYNPFQDSFGALFEIVPNLVPPERRRGGPFALAGQGGIFGNNMQSQ